MEKLRGKLYVMEMGHGELGEALNRSSGYISLRMTGKMAWDMDDVYKICDLLQIPLNEIADYFPPRKRERVER